MRQMWETASRAHLPEESKNRIEAHPSTLRTA
jgi:hypothetical protein